MNTRVGKKLILEHNVVYQMLSDPLFWEKVPELIEMKDEGERAQYLALDRFLNPREVAPGCLDSANMKITLQPILDKLVTQVAQWLEESPNKVENLTAYITKRLGYRPESIIMYSKNNAGKTRTVEF